MTSNNVLTGPWMHQPLPSRISLDQFRDILQQEITEIHTFLQPLQHLCDTVSQTSRFSFCKEARQTLVHFTQRLQKARLLFEDTEHLPLVLTALRYRFYPYFSSLERQTRSCAKLLDDFYIAQTLHASEAHHLAQHVGLHLQILYEKVEILPQAMVHLIDQAYFYDSQLHHHPPVSAS